MERVKARPLSHMYTKVANTDAKENKQESDSKDLNNNWRVPSSTYRGFDSNCVNKVTSAVNDLKPFSQSESHVFSKDGGPQKGTARAKSVRAELEDGTTQINNLEGLRTNEAVVPEIFSTRTAKTIKHPAIFKSKVWTRMMTWYDTPSKLENDAKNKKWAKQRYQISHMWDPITSQTGSVSKPSIMKPGRTPFKAFAINESYVLQSPIASELESFKMADYSDTFLLPTEDDDDEIDKLLNEIENKKATRQNYAATKSEQISHSISTTKTKANLQVGLEVTAITTKNRNKNLTVTWASDIVNVNVYEVETDISDIENDYFDDDDWEVSDDDDNDYALQCAVSDLNGDDTDIDEDFDESFAAKDCRVGAKPYNGAQQSNSGRGLENANPVSENKACFVSQKHNNLSDDGFGTDDNDYEDLPYDGLCSIDRKPSLATDDAERPKQSIGYQKFQDADNDTDVDEFDDLPYDEQSAADQF